MVIIPDLGTVVFKSKIITHNPFLLVHTNMNVQMICLKVNLYFFLRIKNKNY